MKIPPVLKIMGGTASGQIITLALTPLLLRWYSPQDLGVLAVALAIALTASVGVTLRYELAVGIPSDEETAKGLTVVALSSCLAAVAISVSVLGVGIWLGLHVAGWLFLCAPIAGIAGGTQVLNAVSLRRREFGPVALRGLLQSAITVSAQLVWPLVLPPSSWGLIVGYLVGQFVVFAYYIRALGTGPLRSSVEEGRRAAARYRRFPLVLTPAGILNMLSVHAPTLLVAAIFGTHAAGLLALTQRVIGLPVSLVGQSITSVYVAEATAITRGGSASDLRRLFRNYTIRLSLLALLSAIGVYTLAPPAIGLMFGPTWQVSGELAEAMAVVFAAQLIVSPLSQTLAILERTYDQFLFDAVRLLVVAGTIALCAAAGLTLIATVWAFSIVSCGTYLSAWLLSLRAITRWDRPTRNGD